VIRPNRPEARGRLAIVLHTHMPYVEGFGTWPFGEEWLWEAMATSYLPLLEVLDRRPGRVTVSLTPVLADQLAAPGVAERFLAFMNDVRPESHRLDVEAHPEVAGPLERSAERYRSAAAAFAERGGDLVAAFAPHVRWTSAATHSVLPLLATDAGVRLQLRTGIASHRARFGGWGGGFWLPECAHAPWLDPLLEEAGVRVGCVDLTPLVVDPLVPLRTPAGPVLVPIDRAMMDLVWSSSGYPSAAPYLETHALTTRRHLAWSIDGRPYEPARAVAQVRADAADFAERAAERLSGGGLSVCALDTELLGHWWPEGVLWLAEVLDACAARGVPVVPLDEAAVEGAAGLEQELPVTTWGEPRTLETWSGPRAGGLAWRQRAAELRVLGAGLRAGERALRELLALQSSDWAFLHYRDLAGPYPLDRALAHEAALDAALSETNMDPALRSLAPFLQAGALREP
jgi:1,4-alpha-glucan branching enzyme